MKKKLLLLIPACMLLGSLVWTFAAADEDDPLASLSYLTGEFMEELEEKIEKALDKSDKSLLKEWKDGDNVIEVDIASTWTERRMK